jgi:hypothetical protein
MLRKILVFTSFLIGVPAIKNILHTQDKIEIILDCLILFTCILSVLFWSNPVKNSIRHKLDGFFAKLSIIACFLFVFLYQKNNTLDKLSFLLSLMMIITIFILSNTCSKNTWVSPNHILCHVIFHIIVILSLSEIL